jgi:hypothetical protein
VCYVTYRSSERRKLAIERGQGEYMIRLPVGNVQQEMKLSTQIEQEEVSMLAVGYVL